MSRNFYTELHSDNRRILLNHCVSLWITIAIAYHVITLHAHPCVCVCELSIPLSHLDCIFDWILLVVLALNLKDWMAKIIIFDIYSVDHIISVWRLIYFPIISKCIVILKCPVWSLFFSFFRQGTFSLQHSSIAPSWCH